MTTAIVNSVTESDALSGGDITNVGGSLISERGVCWSTSHNPTIADSKIANASGTGTFVSHITKLIVNTTYYVRAYAINKSGECYGDERTFTTLNGIINIKTSNPSNISIRKATLSGEVSLIDGSTISEIGICWNTTPGPTTMNEKVSLVNKKGSFTYELVELSPSTKYFVKVFAKNGNGTTYGNEISFTTLPANGTVKDIDGNIYNYITIGAQTWMAENLKTTKYQNGDPITENTSTWNENLTTEAQCAYNNDIANAAKYGRLYNWYAVADSRKIAPIGWHVPSVEEWVNLQNYLVENGYNYDGTFSGQKIAKSLAAKTDWETTTIVGAIGNDLSENNKTGFNALPGGIRQFYGSFSNLGSAGCWWSTGVIYDKLVSVWALGYDGSAPGGGTSFKEYGFSIRCIMD